MTDSPTTTPLGVSIAERMHRVMLDVTSVGKTGWNEGQKFSFRGIDELLNHVGPAFRAHGVIPLPTVVSVVQGAYESEETNNKGTWIKRLYWARVKVRYTFVGIDGDELVVEMPGEAFDSYDKATTKALSQAYKYALVQALALPTHEVDPDAQNPGQTRERPERDDRPQQQTRRRPAGRNGGPAPESDRRPPSAPTAPKPTVEAMVAAMDDIVEVDARKRVKAEFVERFGLPPELTVAAVDSAWLWLTDRLEMTEHDFLQGDENLCALCGSTVVAPWHPESPPTGREGPGMGETTPGPDGAPHGERRDQSGDASETVPDRVWADVSEEWIATAKKSELIDLCERLQLDSSGNVPELRERLITATQPFA